MTKSLDNEPWRELPAEVADLIEPELPAVTEEIIATIAREVPEYARPLEGRFGRGIRTGVDEALLQFVALIRDPDAGRHRGREVYVALGRGEQRVGRTLDALQAAYRVGARVAWRRIAGAGHRADLGSEHLALLAEAIFAYIDELSADSVEGYAEAQAEVEGLRRRRRQELAATLVAGEVEAGDVATAARAAEWAVPATVAAGACRDDDLAVLGRRLPHDSLATVLDGTGCLLIPDPDGPGRRSQLSKAAQGTTLAVGPAVEPAAARDSWALAEALLRASAGGAIEPGGLLLAEEHLADLLLFESRRIAVRIAARRLQPLAELTPKARERMRETALAHVRHGGNAVAMAAELHVHPQTARYRIARLRELFGAELDDPDARFELEIALRAEGGE